MQQQFIERGTDFSLRNGKLSLYETNCACKNIQFFFSQYVLTLMVSGHKTIVSENLTFEFFPGTLFIPEKDVVNAISIPNASLYNPTQCLVLELNPAFLRSVYEEITYSDSQEAVLLNQPNRATKSYFLSNDQLLIKAFLRLYEIQLKDTSLCKPLVEDLIIKEMLYRLFYTDAAELLKGNFEKSIDNVVIQKVIAHIKQNVNRKLTIESLAEMAGVGQTTFFKLFKKSTGLTPIEFVLRERIRQAKIMIQKDRLSLQEIAFKTGFNSYEYFCSSFKKVERIKPSEYKKGQHLALKM
ncbi:MAG: AraC family transcriptional regulator [Bacteroidota bacterium]